MRLMMRALLADRFKLAIHNETREVPVFAFVLVKPGKTGPQLKLHSEGVPCSTDLHGFQGAGRQSPLSTEAFPRFATASSECLPPCLAARGPRRET